MYFGEWYIIYYTVRTVVHLSYRSLCIALHVLYCIFYCHVGAVFCIILYYMYRAVFCTTLCILRILLNVL